MAEGEGVEPPDALRHLLISSFNRTIRDAARLEVPGFAKIPLVGQAFRKSTASTQNRSVMLLARPELVQRQASKVGGS